MDNTTKNSEKNKLLISSSEENKDIVYKKGDYVIYYTYRTNDLESEPFQKLVVNAEVIKVRPKNKYDIKLLVPPFNIEVKFDGKYLFPVKEEI